MGTSFDAIVIGSGFGGSVAACRLAESGHRVLVLERGRRWRPEDYPRKPGDGWFYDPDEPQNQNGWIDLRFLDDMVVIQGAGVGGGSLIYANISVEAPKEIFPLGWPAEINYEELKPYYDTVGKMLNVQVLPDNQLTKRFQLMRDAAAKLGYADRFDKLPIAVTFSKDWSYDLDKPFDPKHSKIVTNDQGVEQGTCVHLGFCDLGCPVKAKNTLDLNYLAWAEKKGAEIRPLHVVRSIEPDGTGYRVRFDRIHNGQLTTGFETAAKVIVAAGSLGSTELLLRCRDQYKTLPGISSFLGRNWSSNGDFLTPAFHEGEINPTQGPTITAAIDFLDASFRGQRFYIEDGGFPDLVQGYLEEKLAGRSVRGRLRAFMASLEKNLEKRPPLSNVMPWFAQGVDAANGKLYLGRKWYAPWKRVLKLDWDVTESAPVIEAIIAMHEKLAEATGGDPWVPPTWTVLKNLVTPHPLGGCNMGSYADTGVVNHLGQVFGYPNLYVLDGAIVPEAIGRNPSRTIAALAERSLDLAAGK